MSQESQGANFIWMGRNLNLLFLCLMWMHCTLQGCCSPVEGMCLPVPVQGNTFPSLCLLEVVHAKFRTYQIETQNSGWLMNAMVRGCLLSGYFFLPEFVVCLPVLMLHRFLSGNMEKVSGCAGTNRSLHNGEGKCAKG